MKDRVLLPWVLYKDRVLLPWVLYKYLTGEKCVGGSIEYYTSLYSPACVAGVYLIPHTSPASNPAVQSFCSM